MADVFTGCGEQLRRAREAAGLSIEAVSSRSRMPVRVIHAIEAEDWDTLGAPVFIRGQLRSYARLLDVDLGPQLQPSQATASALPPLVSHSHTPPLRRLAEQAGRRAVYIALTVVIAAPIIFASRSHLGGRTNGTIESLDDFAVATPPAVGQKAKAAPVQRTPVMASMAPITPAAPATVPALELVFSGDSWLEVYATDGRTLEKGNLKSGERRSFEAGQVGRVVVGNSSAAQVLHAGKPVDLATFSRANVARFTLSSDGSPAPVVD
ncbi:helix-turn-helix domain-containing protein [Aerolutibacter ruishenii]|uniref:helix-turn-helix domain-containing protein n=1 Tax=Aerolutibacter ruishenii TaxID=686800 RepID=UPI001F551478|nr:helix-turn-helix domain-containing protein [Lysobacter ruishenii]